MKQILAKIFGGAGGGIAEKISGIIDKHTFSKEEKARFEKEMTEVFIKAEADMQQNVTDRWKTDMASDSWLSKNIRPITLIFLTGVFVILSVFDGNMGEFTIGAAYVPVYQTLLMTVYAAYFAGRSIEKVKKVTK